MDNLKSVLISVIILVALGLIGYWSFVTLQSGTEYVVDQNLKQLRKENEDLKKEVKILNDQVSSLQSKVEALTSKQESQLEASKPVAQTSLTIYKYQTLITELQQLVKDNVSMKLGSTGPRVGTIQKFLNIYNKTSNAVDNDYGEGTKKGVTAFQKSSGLSADGEAGVGTFNKMIDWLKKQG